MAEKQLKTRIQLKIDTEKNWIKATKFIPKKGEVVIYEPDSTNSQYRIKIGDGSTFINSLDFAIGDYITNDEINAICGATIYDQSEVQV